MPIKLGKFRPRSIKFVNSVVPSPCKTEINKEVKNCDSNLKILQLPWAVFSRPRSQVFTIQISQPANNLYISSQTVNPTVKT